MSRRHVRRVREATAQSFSASGAASFAMTGATSTQVRDVDRPVPFYGVDDPVPFSLRGENMAVWGEP